MALAFQGRHLAADAVGDRHDRDAVLADEREIGEGHREPEPRQALLRPGLGHRAAAVEEYVHVELLDLLVDADEHTFQARIQAPVHQAVVVARDVVPVVLELAREARGRSLLHPLLLEKSPLA